MIKIGVEGNFWPANGGAPMRATVIHVWSETCVNLRLDDGEADTVVTSVLVVQEPQRGAKPNGYYFVPHVPNVFIQPVIKGYRQLSHDEAALMNEIKTHGEQLGALVAKLRALPDLDQRWVSIGATDLQTGLMALTRGVARPTSF